MICNNCGAKEPDGYSYCGNCGKPVQVPQDIYPSINTTQPSPSLKPKKWPWVLSAVITFLVMVAFSIVLLLTINPETQKPITNNDELITTSELSTEFTFDKSSILTISTEIKPIPTVANMNPISGSIGHKIIITGENLLNHPIVNVTLGDFNMNLYDVSDDTIEVMVPYGAQSDVITIIYENSTIEVGQFEVIPQTKTLLVEEVLDANNDIQTIIGGEISVTLPANILASQETIKIQKILNPNNINLPKSMSSSAFSVTLGDLHEFEKAIFMDVNLINPLPGEPSAAYFDENTSLWDTLPSEIIDGKLRIYTDHFTDFIIFYWGKAIYSSDGYFKIYYDEDDTHSYGADMDDLAKTIGEALEEARKDYNILPENYREDFSYLGFRDSMDVYLDSNAGDATYNPMTNNIILPTDFKDIDDLETTAAHELFHAYQDTVWNEFGYVGKIGRHENKWAVEALAELAAYELAFPEKQRERQLVKDVNSQNPYDTLDNDHEYNMSCFLSYLLDKTQTDFDDLWISVVNNDKVTLGVCIDDFFKSASSDYISLDLSYMDFWKAVISDTTAPTLLKPENQFSKRKIYLLENQHSASFTYTGKDSTTAFNLFASRSFSDNMPVRIFCVTPLADANYRVLSAKLTGLQNPKDLNDFRVPLGYAWDAIYHDLSLGDTYKLYTLEQGNKDTVLIALESTQGGSQYGVTINEIQGLCSPKAMENVLAGKEQDFNIAFKDIFDFVDTIELVIDFGDGTIETYKTTNENGQFSYDITHTFGNEISADAVTCSLYNTTQGNNELISKLVIPMKKGIVVNINATPNPVYTEDTVTFATNIIESDYTYLYEFGDGLSSQITGVSTTNHTYDRAGKYTVKLIIYDSDSKVYGEASKIVSIEEQEIETEEEDFVDNGNNDDFVDESNNVSYYNIDELDISNIRGRWKGIAVVTSLVNLENFTYGSSEKITDEMVVQYLSIINEESEFFLEVDGSSLLVSFSHYFGDEFAIYKGDFTNDSTLINGELSGNYDMPDWGKCEIRGILTEVEGGTLLLTGTVDVTDYISHFGEGDKKYEIAYSYTFTAQKIP